MKDLRFIAIITGPEEYLDEGVKVEDFTISWDDILDAIEDLDEEGNPSEEEVVDAIQYLKDDYAAEWEQRWCRAILMTEDQFELVKKTKI